MSEPTLADLEKRVAALEERLRPKERPHYLNEPFEVVPFDGEMPLKCWLNEEAIRCGVCPQAIYNRVQRGNYPDLVLRRVNKRVVFVSKRV